jgi:ketosteroid isomerase-like protein
MTSRVALIVGVVLYTMPLAGYSGQTSANVETIVAHHLASAERGDVDALMADYAADAVLITPDTAITGRSAIRAVFQRLVGGNSAPGSRQGALQVQKQVFKGSVGYLLWVQHAGTPDEVRGSDTFFIRDGKIIAQTVVMVPGSPRRVAAGRDHPN